MGETPEELMAGVEMGPTDRETGACLAALFPENMGNRGQNVLDVGETARKLARVSARVPFVAYHWRISGNFVFQWTDEKTVRGPQSSGGESRGLDASLELLTS